MAFKNINRTKPNIAVAGITEGWKVPGVLSTPVCKEDIALNKDPKEF